MKKIHPLLILIMLLLSLIGCTRISNEGSDNKEAINITDEALLDSVQHRTFNYFWDGAEPVSGMARERFHVDGEYPGNDKNVITSGGSGFGIMAMIAGMERGLITRAEGLERMEKIVSFLRQILFTELFRIGMSQLVK